MEAEEEIFFSDDEDLSCEGEQEEERDKLIPSGVEVSESLHSEVIEEKEVNNHNPGEEEPEQEPQEEHQDRIFPIACFPEKGEHSLSACFSSGVRCANCVSKLLYTPSCRNGQESKTCACPKCDPSSLVLLRCDRCGILLNDLTVEGL